VKIEKFSVGATFEKCCFYSSQEIRLAMFLKSKSLISIFNELNKQNKTNAKIKAAARPILYSVGGVFF
jgi:hypothetical protein